MSELSFKQRLHNALGAQEIENVKARHSYWHAMSYSKEEWDNIWHKGKHTTWAHFFGRMVGFDEVWSGSVIDTDDDVYSRYPQRVKQNPQISHMDPRAVGSAGCHCLASPVIEVAEDGQTARASYLTPGIMMGALRESFKASGSFLWERYGSDFVCRDGKWLYFHEQVCPDFGSSYSSANWAHDTFANALKGIYKSGGGSQPKNITDPGPFHSDYTPVQTVQRTVPWPEPYKTLDDANSYSPGRNNPDL